MGCTAEKNNKIIIVSRISNSNLSSTGAWKKNNRFSIEYNSIRQHKFPLQNQYLNSITNMLWVKIIDYLSYNELKEVGKINRKFNKLVKTNNIVLVKFFKKKNSIYSKNVNITFSIVYFNKIKSFFLLIYFFNKKILNEFIFF